MTQTKQWTLGGKLTLVVAPFLLLVLLSTTTTLWVSWQLDGGAAAVNEAGRMRMQAYRMSLSVGTDRRDLLAGQIHDFEQSLAVLRAGDPERPLFVPWDDTLRRHFAEVSRNWEAFRTHWLQGDAVELKSLPEETGKFVADIDTLVLGIESHMARRTALLYLLQMSVLGVAIVVAAILIYTGYIFVLEPVGLLTDAVKRIQQGNFDARVEHVSSDEFGTLATGFNGMAENLQQMYRHLEHKVAEKTSELEEKRERLESLYEVTALVANASALDDLAQGFVKAVARIARADGAAVRWSDQENRRFLMLAAHGLPLELVSDEQCIASGDCRCGSAQPETGVKVFPIRLEPEPEAVPCAKAGYRTVITIPIRMHERLMGEVELFFHAHIEPPAALRSLLEALTSHLAGAMENLRLNALEREAAVAQERIYLARELHDSIAQSLAFIKIQVQLMRDAIDSGTAEDIQVILEDIDAGVRESYGDVRELLMHFRTRANSEDIEPALATTLRKFEHQSGVSASLQIEGQGLPLSPDLQIQVLHIIQEALSNVRKHARATQVTLSVQRQPAWRFEVRDDGCGFAHAEDQLDETHVGLRIMKERAQRLGAELSVASTPGQGTVIVLTLPLPAPAIAPGAAAAPSTDPDKATS